MLPQAGLSLPLALLLVATLAPSPSARPISVKAKNVSRASGINDDRVHTYAATVADFDGNGWDDALLVRHHDSFPWLMLNEAGSFTNVNKTAFPSAPRRRDFHDCPAGDVNGDELLDFYCTVGGGGGGTRANPSQLWLQMPDGTFRKRTAAWGVRDPYGRGRAATFVDANGDEHPDLYVANAYPRKDGRRAPNRLFINVDGERFRQGREFRVHKEVGGESFVQAVDFDRDGREDLAVCGKEHLVFYRNIRNRRYRDLSRKLNFKRPCRDGVIARMDRNGRPDLVRMTPRGLDVWLQDRNGKLRSNPAYERSIRGARAVAVGDVNKDKIPDIYVVRSRDYDPRNVPGPNVRGDRRDVMLLSRGNVRSYRRTRIPQFRKGIGDAVVPIDHDRNGLTDFIVMNGFLKARGPIRLIAFYPR